MRSSRVRRRRRFTGSPNSTLRGTRQCFFKSELSFYLNKQLQLSVSKKTKDSAGKSVYSEILTTLTFTYGGGLKIGPLPRRRFSVAANSATAKSDATGELPRLLEMSTINGEISITSNGTMVNASVRDPWRKPGVGRCHAYGRGSKREVDLQP